MQETCRDARSPYCNCYRHARFGPEYNECARGDACSWPDHGHAFRLCEQRETEVSGEQVSHSHRNAEPNGASPRPCIAPHRRAGRRLMPRILVVCICLHRQPMPIGFQKSQRAMITKFPGISGVPKCGPDIRAFADNDGQKTVVVAKPTLSISLQASPRWHLHRERLGLRPAASAQVCPWHYPDLTADSTRRLPSGVKLTLGSNGCEVPGLSSRPGEFHPRALPEPCMNLSIHTAPDVRPLP